MVCRQGANYPDTKTVSVGSFKIGLCHGHQVGNETPTSARDSATSAQDRRHVCTGDLPASTKRVMHPTARANAHLPADGARLFGCLLAPQVVPWGEKESLAMLQRQLDVDVLITGHTHKCKVPPRAPRDVGTLSTERWGSSSGSPPPQVRSVPQGVHADRLHGRTLRTSGRGAP